MNIGMLLAAGSSTRMQRPKQNLIWKGMSFVDWTTRQLFEAGCEHVLIVEGAYPLTQNHSHVLVRHNDDWRTGQSSSLQFGIESVLAEFSGVQNVLVSVCDQPQVLASHYRQLLNSLTKKSITVAATKYPSGGGVPACFSAEVLSQLHTGMPDQGAKRWIRSLPVSSKYLIEIPEARFDLDTPVEYHAAIQTNAHPCDVSNKT